MSVELLKKCELFQELSQETLEKFVGAATKEQKNEGDIVFVELSEGDEIYFISSGKLKIECALSSEDDQVEIVILGEGDVFGEQQFVFPGPRTATATANSNLELLVWKAADWRTICDQDVKSGYLLALAIARLLSKRLQAMNVKMLNQVSWGI